MKVFYVNAFRDKKIENLEYGKRAVGLFGEHGFQGYGNFCGWYGVECYTNTEMYAHYICDDSCLYAPEKRISDVTIHTPPIKYDEIEIGSVYWEYIIRAESLEEAIEKFKNADWTRR